MPKKPNIDITKVQDIQTDLVILGASIDDNVDKYNKKKTELEKWRKKLEKQMLPLMKSTREALKINLEVLGKNIGYSQSYLSQCENKKRPVPIPILFEYYKMITQLKNKK